MNTLSSFSDFSSCDYADFLEQNSFMDHGIRPLHLSSSRLVGKAYTVRCDAGDNLMVHAAIYKAPPGSILVIDAGDVRSAVAGGNVCATAQQRGIKGFIIDGVIRDVGEIRRLDFSVYA
ncbi:RraA family protein [Alginatibacterium sediminis]|uniref:Putative 4-hydroxy-4-methyl-2-oxoglutarate aldolase n=1 Tax=Alginatibacterium sediminis TaxID=2164068 RepID=A0A420EJU2_9ALTE|nr:RraA family protein [Alginatibacterium sediminis]RKF20928.1 RraA family protein [Alginatibacterium sediminis]